MISYAPHVPSTPDEYIKPYVDFINNISHIDAHCDFDLTDSYECDVYAYIYDFRYFLKHHDGKIIFSLVSLPKRGAKFDSLKELDELVNKFNKNHSTSLSYEHEVVKRFFIRRTYIPNHYYLKLELPLSSENKSIANAVKIFYSDVVDFFKAQPFGEMMPKANYTEESGYSFINYLQDEILHLEAYEKGIFDNLVTESREESNTSEK